MSPSLQNTLIRTLSRQEYDKHCVQFLYTVCSALGSLKRVGIMWGGSISREQLQQQITLLAMLGGVQESVKYHQLTSPPNYQSSLTIDQESEIVSNLSFLSSRGKDSKQVVAVAIEVTEKSHEMIIRMAVNGEDAAYLKKGLVQIANILEKAAQMDASASHYTDLLLRQVITSDFSRILTRLQMNKKYPLTTSRIMTLQNLLHEKALNDTDGIDFLRASVRALQQCYSSLKGLPQLQINSTTCAMLEEVTRLAYRLTSAIMVDALDKSSQAGKTKLLRLEDSVTKLGHYYKACSQLVAAARRKKCLIFGNIRVEDYQANIPQTIKLSTPTSIPPVLESQIESLPKQTSANKSSCYLCDIFFNLHGQFQVPSTYGQLNERWILRDWLDGISEQREIALRSIVRQVSSILSTQIQAASRSLPHLPTPLESLIGRPASWSASVLSLPSQVVQNQVSRSALCTSKPDVKFLNLDVESALQDNKGKPYLSPMGSSSSSSSFSSGEAVLSLGDSFSRQLCGEGQSFTVHFYENYAVLSFDDTLGQIEDLLARKIWVEVEILGYKREQLQDGKNTRDIQMLPEGAKVALGSSIGYDTPIYLRYKEMVLSIRFIKKSSRKK